MTCMLWTCHYAVVMSAVSGVEIQCIGHFKLLFSLLRVDGCARIQLHALEVSLHLLRSMTTFIMHGLSSITILINCNYYVSLLTKMF